MEYLKGNFALHPVVIEQIIPPSWSTKTEQFGSTLFLVLFFPVYSKERKETRAREVDVIVGKNFLLTSHYNSVLPLKSVFDECNLYEDLREQHMKEGSGRLLYHVLHTMWKEIGIKTSRIDKKLNLIEESMFHGEEREMLKEISFSKADIINFWRIVRPQKGVFTSLETITPEFFGKETALLYPSAQPLGQDHERAAGGKGNHKLVRADQQRSLDPQDQRNSKAPHHIFRYRVPYDPSGRHLGHEHEIPSFGRAPRRLLDSLCHHGLRNSLYDSVL